MHIAGLILGSMLVGQVLPAATATAGQSPGINLLAQNDWSSSPGSSSDRYHGSAAGVKPGGAAIRQPSFDGGGDSSPRRAEPTAVGGRRIWSPKRCGCPAATRSASR